MVIAALIVAALFVVLGGVRVFGARRAAFPANRLWAALLAIAAAVLALRGLAAFALAAGAAAAAAFLIWGPRQTASPQQQASAADSEAWRILGLQPGASTEQIRAAFRAKMARAHPDRGGDSNAAARLTAARDQLLERLKGA